MSKFDHFFIYFGQGIISPPTKNLEFGALFNPMDANKSNAIHALVNWRTCPLKLSDNGDPSSGSWDWLGNSILIRTIKVFAGNEIIFWWQLRRSSMLAGLPRFLMPFITFGQ